MDQSVQELQSGSRLDIYDLALLAFFDMFERPLTAQELQQWRLLPAILPHWLPGDSDVSTDAYAIHQGWYCLSDSTTQLSTRNRRYRISERKFQRAKFFCSLARYIPYVRLVAVCNTLSFDNAREDSDIDVLIVIRHSRLWLSRALITIMAQVLRLRRHGSKIADRICLSFYITDDALNLSPLLLQPVDVYFVFWLQQLIPIYDHGGVYDQLQASNLWLREYLEHPQKYYPAANRQVTNTRWSQIVQRWGEWALNGLIGDWLERLTKQWQYRHIAGHKDSKLWVQSTDVVVSDTILKFHEHDRRALFLNQWHQRLQKFK